MADVNHEGRGYGTAGVRATLRMLFDVMGARRIQLHCDEDNARSIHVAERCGFVREGLVREGSESGRGLPALVELEF